MLSLHERIHGGSYRAKPSRSSYISEPDGRQRPLGIAALDNKIAQRVVVEALSAIYEGRLPRILLRVSARTRPTRYVGRARGRDQPA
jgi:hypothetical protein